MRYKCFHSYITYTAPNVFSVAAAILLLTNLLSCGQPMAPDLDLKPDPEKGYVFGNFGILTFDRRLSVQLMLENLSDREKPHVLIPFMDGHGAVHPISVEPGKYRFSHDMIFGNPLTADRKPLDLKMDHPLFEPFEVPPNTLVYLGRSHTRSRYTRQGNVHIREIQVPELQYSVDSDARLLMLYYPEFNGMPIREARK